MTQRLNKKFLFYLFIFLFLTLISIFIIEYKLGYKPCKLCLYQRIPYLLGIIVILKMLFFKSYEKISLLMLSIIFFCSLILGFYHFGIEQGFFAEPSTCTTDDLSKTLSKEDLIKQLNENSPSCKEVSFNIFGLSLAAINTIFSFVLSVIFLRLFSNYEKN